jgi:hypothetical protein
MIVTGGRRSDDRLGHSGSVDRVNLRKAAYWGVGMVVLYRGLYVAHKALHII